MRRALFVTTVASTMEAFLLPFADRLREQGWEVDALCDGASGSALVEAHFDQRYDATWRRNPLAISNLTAYREVRELVGSRGYDVVHVHTPVAAFVTRMAIRSMPLLRRPVVIYTAHGFHFYRGQRLLPRLAYRSLERKAAAWTDYLVTINEEDFAAARAFGTIPRERVRYSPGIGVDCSCFGPMAVSPDQARSVRTELGLPESAFMVTMIAEFSARKRHAHVLEALSLVGDSSAVVVFVGVGPLMEEIRKRAARRGLEGRVRFAGFRSDIPAVLATSDVLLLVSHHEGLARSVLESMASGVPVIGTKTRGIEDAIGGEAGWVVAKNDADALARAIDSAAADRREVVRRGMAARERVCAEYSLTEVLSLHDALYREAMMSRG